MRNNFNLVVLGIRHLSEHRRSQTFVAINDNAKRVDANLVSYLRYTPDEKICKANADLMAIKIAFELNKVSPFEDSIQLLDLPRKKITLKSMSGYDLKGLISKQGLLRKYYPSNGSRVYVRVIRDYFSVVRNVFKKEWDDPKTFIIATNRGVLAFIKLLRSILKTEQKKMTKPMIRIYMVALQKHWPETWETRKLREAYVGSGGWVRFHRKLISSILKDPKLKHLQE